MFMLAYTFWHWRKASVARHDYEARVQQFHLALRAHPSAGFSRSYSLAFIGAPWANAGAEAYEDWYLVEGSAALDPLNEAAISASRQVPHDAAAAAAAGGTAGLYRLRLGTWSKPPTCAYWFAKPAGASYPGLFAVLQPLISNIGGALWARQMTLGPSPEFCLHVPGETSLPGIDRALLLQLRSVWPSA